MSNILGNGIPQFVGTGTPDSATRVLNYATIIEPSLSEQITQMNESIISFKRNWDNKGRHATVVVEVKLDLYDSNPLGIASLPAAKTFFNTLCSYEHQDVYFHLSTNGPRFKNTSNTDITLHLENIEMTFDNLEGLIGDKAILTFRTNEPYDLSKLVIA